jgi:hypothetical protein
MEFKLFHTIIPDEIARIFSELDLQEDDIEENIPDELKPFEIKLSPGANTRKAGCHQKGWKEYKREPKSLPQTPISLVLINSNKWITDEEYKQNYCISLIIEHTASIEIYNTIRTEVQQRVRVR